MKFELADLKTPDALNEYCRRTLGQPQQRGSLISIRARLERMRVSSCTSRNTREMAASSAGPVTGAATSSTFTPA